VKKIRLAGTHHAVAPETTWERIALLLTSFGITRIADVTELEHLGIPVMVAVRPAAEILGTSQGKGATRLLAKLSAAMEAVELWHAERLGSGHFSATAQELDLPYAFSDLHFLHSGFDASRLRLRWAWARALDNGEPAAVPFDLVQLTSSGEYNWSPDIFARRSNGLASGNTFTEACLHALYEVIERDALSGVRSRGDRIVLKMASVPDGHIRSLVDRLDQAAAQYEVAFIPNRLRIPTFGAHIWSPLFPRVCAGSGSHMDPIVATSRAITEAAQTRLTRITTTRDDTPSDYNPMRGLTRDPHLASNSAEQYTTVIHGYGGTFDDLDLELRDVVERVRDVTGTAPLTLDVSTRQEAFSVVKVLRPGLRQPDKANSIPSFPLQCRLARRSRDHG
jgi:ribosomal protein S12 methylthiotransferase accessory factor